MIFWLERNTWFCLGLFFCFFGPKKPYFGKYVSFFLEASLRFWCFLHGLCILFQPSHTAGSEHRGDFAPKRIHERLCLKTLPRKKIFLEGFDLA